ncbi:MAG: GTPase HflX, partial [Proteobacteria bacterium]|nr:GTPase HflX [Pseudomonadota bacterium]
MTQSAAPKTKTPVILASVQLPGISDIEHQASLDELERLCSTLGFATLGRVSQKRKAIVTGTILG